MPDHVRYIQKDGQSVDIAIVRRRFFETALGAGVGPDKACGIWNDAEIGMRVKLSRSCAISRSSRLRRASAFSNEQPRIDHPWRATGQARPAGDQMPSLRSTP